MRLLALSWRWVRDNSSFGSSSSTCPPVHQATRKYPSGQDITSWAMRYSPSVIIENQDPTLPRNSIDRQMCSRSCQRHNSRGRCRRWYGEKSRLKTSSSRDAVPCKLWKPICFIQDDPVFELFRRWATKEELRTTIGRLLLTPAMYGTLKSPPKTCRNMLRSDVHCGIVIILNSQPDSDKEQWCTTCACARLLKSRFSR